MKKAQYRTQFSGPYGEKSWKQPPPPLPPEKLQRIFKNFLIPQILGDRTIFGRVYMWNFFELFQNGNSWKAYPNRLLQLAKAEHVSVRIFRPHQNKNSERLAPVSEELSIRLKMSLFSKESVQCKNVRKGEKHFQNYFLKKILLDCWHAKRFDANLKGYSYRTAWWIRMKLRRNVSHTLWTQVYY